MDSKLNQVKFELGLLGRGSDFNPLTSESKDYEEWVTNFKPTTCPTCSNLNGKVFDKENPPPIQPPVHENCNCMIVAMTAIKAGTATIDGFQGADLPIWNGWGLPDNYVTKDEAEANGYDKYKGNLNEVLPNTFIGGDSYINKNSKLPSKTGRVWQEADINYISGFRNGHRVLYSNDGLHFATYDHYETFYEIN